ncbi:hypothetical protein ABZZ74_43150 [Streptomyces sp. NPDC006476]|uniref:hypothetical protein n=1 Tax=Streptomyces sp. NPDC006476 TaxID=3157175 RepID=UPI0033BABD06
MDNVIVSLSDIEALTQAVDSGTLPAQALLRCLLNAIVSAADGEESISVNVKVETVQDMFEAAFAPEPAPDTSSSGHTVHVTVSKITR